LPPNETASRRLLVADDEHIDRMLVIRSATPLGFTVDAAASLEDAARLLARHTYDAVVLDLALGERESISLLPELRARGGDPIVIFVSGMDDRVRAACARLAATLGLRVAGALAKPVAPTALRALLSRTPKRIEAPDAAETARPTEAELSQAMTSGELATSYQPKVTLDTGAVTGVEALVRWHRPDGTILLPDLFIPMSERCGLIVPLTTTVLEQSLGACRRWRRRFPTCGVAVNVSTLALANPALPDQIEDMLRRAELPPAALTAEITESMIIADPVLAAQVLTRLRIKGIGLSIDDFGTGHSSLLSLMRLPFTELKIDRSFVAACETDMEAWTIIRATISLAHELGMVVVAEGIETASVAQRLAEAGCDLGQGWHFARAMTETALGDWLERQEMSRARSG
jgi:EAL domain-containing protein (putative c-di-GMP-specific phosphodiesterase class I)/ActR/RegA family two-component response regulator